MNKISTAVEETHEKSQKNGENFEKTIEVGKNGTVTLPEVTLGNLSEALRFVRSQEKSILSKMRESNEYVVNEVKDILEQLFNGWSGRKLVEGYGDGAYTTSKGHHYENYENYQRGCFVEEPVEFLENHEGSLSKFMDRLDEELKEDWIMQRYNPRYVSVKTQNKLDEIRRGKSISELKSIDLKDVSFVEIFKEEIQNLSKMPESESDDFYHLKFNYMRYIIHVCEDLGYKYG